MQLITQYFALVQFANPVKYSVARFGTDRDDISHDRWFLDRIATHMLAFEGDGKVVFFDGNYSEYEENKKARLGNVEPTRFKYRKLM